VFDLYVDDYVPIDSLTRHTYHLTVTDSSTPLRVTIAWVDPPNIVWAVKNLLNDIDLLIITPSGDTLYGNSIIGDEYNTQERVTYDLPMVGEYQILVQSKIFPTQTQGQTQTTPQQTYSIVITSAGQVDETKFQTETISISDLNLIDSCADAASAATSADGLHIHSTSSDLVRVQFQLEDWYAGESFQNSSVTLAIVDTKAPSVLHSECSFLSNEIQEKAEFTRSSQCSFCLSKKASYTAQLITNHTLSPSGSSGSGTSSVGSLPLVIRAVSPQCEISLSSYQPVSSLMINGEGDCNVCPSSSGALTVMMYANVTDDDESQYSW
jgi:hypothetical protein